VLRDVDTLDDLRAWAAEAAGDALRRQQQHPLLEPIRELLRQHGGGGAGALPG
jgi:hypothetical protein